VVHKDIITARSAFFRAAINGNFKEAHDKLIRLPDCDADLFAIYVQWLYSGAIVLLDSSALEQDPIGSAQRQLLIGLYVLGDKLRDTALRNMAIDCYIINLEQQGLMPGSASIDRIWNCTPENSKLRKLVLDFALWMSDEKLVQQLEAMRKTYSLAFLADIAIALAKAGRTRSKTLSPHKSPACTYHDHDEVEPSCPDQQRRPDSS